MYRRAAGNEGLKVAMRNAVCLCCDRNMIVPAMFVASTVAASRTDASEFDVVVVTAGSDALADDHRRWLNERDILVHEGFDLTRFKGVKIQQARLSAATLIKLFLAELFAGVYDRILYLDSDLVVRHSVAPIFLLDLGGHPMAAVPSSRIPEATTRKKWQAHFGHLRALGMTEPYRYINTGVILVDVAAWNKSNLAMRTLDFILRNPAICILPDEDALNGVVNGGQCELSPLWNMRAGAWAVPAVRDAIDPVIIHYDGPAKPWKRFARGVRLFQHREAYSLFETFLAATPWSHWLDQQWRTVDLLENLYFELRHVAARVTNTDPPGPQKGFAAAFRRYCAETTFADVEQGIATAQNGRLQLSRQVVSARSATTAGAGVGA